MIVYTTEEWRNLPVHQSCKGKGCETCFYGKVESINIKTEIAKYEREQFNSDHRVVGQVQHAL